jgi:hypothetical protein
MNADNRKRTYAIKRLDSCRGEWPDKLDSVNIDIFPWPQTGHDFCPVTTAKMAVCDDCLFVYMETNETEIRVKEKDFSGLVYTDSCMELFLMPDPGNSSQYLNWEFNPAGSMYLAIGTHRFDRHDVRDDNYRELFQVKTVTHNNGWNLEYRIPLVFLRCCFPSLKLKKGHVMRGNFYKCGDKTARPHFGCWSPIELPKPDFHCPGFFGDLILN